MLQELLALQPGTPPRLMLNSHCPRCEFRQRCQAEALAKDDLSLLRGLSATEITKYNKRGIFTVTQLSCTFRPPKRRKTSPHKPPLHQPALQALALRDQKIYVHGTPQLPVCSTRIYLDLEGDPDRQFVYLLGMVVQAGAVEERYTFWADTPAEEARLYQQFLEIVARYPDSWLYTYGSYEATFLRRMGKGAACPTLDGQLLSRVVNVLSLIYAHVYFPTYSNGLKDIGQYLGCRWSAAEASGLQSIVWRRQWETTGAAAFKDTLITYNMEDCLALRTVTEFLYTVCSRPPAARDGPPTCACRTAGVAGGRDDTPVEPTGVGHRGFCAPRLRLYQQLCLFRLPARSDLHPDQSHPQASPDPHTQPARQAQSLGQSLRRAQQSGLSLLRWGSLDAAAG